MSNNSWVVIPFNECFIRRRTERAILVRLPRWVDDVIGNFWIPAGCLKYTNVPVADFGKKESRVRRGLSSGLRDML